MDRDRLERHEIGSGALRAVISVQGAELQSLRDASGEEWLWQAGPAWPRHAPVLFPIVGRLPGDTLRALLTSPETARQVCGVRLLANLPVPVLRDQAELLFTSSQSPDADMRAAVRPSTL